MTIFRSQWPQWRRRRDQTPKSQRIPEVGRRTDQPSRRTFHDGRRSNISIYSLLEIIVNSLMRLYWIRNKGFSVEGNENIQEILSKQLYLCQFLCALSVLRTGGNFVCKLFDLFTPFSVGLVYLMYLCFDRISIHKPVTSRPANSERYVYVYKPSVSSLLTICTRILCQIYHMWGRTWVQECHLRLFVRHQRHSQRDVRQGRVPRRRRVHCALVGSRGRREVLQVHIRLKWEV